VSRSRSGRIQVDERYRLRFTDAMQRTPALLGLAAVVGTVVGFVLAPDGFLGNLIAELVGILVGVALALTIAEELTRRRRREQWARVRRQTLRSLCGYIEDLALSFAMSLPDAPLDIRTNAHWVDYPSSVEVEAACEGFRDLERRLETDVPALSRQADLKRSSSRVLFDETNQKLLAIRDVLAPRILSLDEDPDLSRLLGDLEEAARRWGMVLPAIEDWGVPDGEGWEEARKVFHRARLVYEDAAHRLLAIAS
jgi:hypothetical protein